MFFLVFYYYGIYILLIMLLWHVFTKVLHRLFGPTFEWGVFNWIRYQSTIDYLVRFGADFNGPYRKYCEDRDPKIFKKYGFFTNKLLACVGTSLHYLVELIPRIFDEDRSNPIAIALFILWLCVFLILTPVCFTSFIFWLLYWLFKLVKQKYYKDRRPLRIKHSFHYFLTPKICRAVKRKTSIRIVHFPLNIEFVLASSIVRVHSFTRHILELLIWVVVKRPYYFSLKSLDYILRVHRSDKSKFAKILPLIVGAFRAISFICIIGLPKSVLDLSYRTSLCLQQPLIHMKKASHFLNYLKSKNYHYSIYIELIQNSFAENEERSLRGLRVPISLSHHLPPLDYESRLSLNLYLFENLNENFKFM